MIILNSKRFLAISTLLLLAGCLPPPASGELRTTPPAEEMSYNSDVQLAKRAKDAALNVGTKPVPAAGDTRNVALGDITMRSVAARLDQISLWRGDDENNKVDRAIWDGAKPKDIAAILPSLIGSKNEEAKKITYRIAMSAAYTPDGMDAMDYVRWRANVLAADKKYTEAARLLNVARIGRDSNVDLNARIAFELASGQVESACAEAMAAGHATDVPFWQGLQALCAYQVGDADAAQDASKGITDNDMKAAAEKLRGKSADTHPLIAALVNASGALPLRHPLSDDEDLVDHLKSLLSAIKDADDPKAALQDKQGDVLLFTLGALAAEQHGDDTHDVTHQALELLKLN